MDKIPLNPDKVYSDLDPEALEAAIEVAEERNRGPINSPAISAAIVEYLKRAK